MSERAHRAHYIAFQYCLSEQKIEGKWHLSLICDCWETKTNAGLHASVCVGLSHQYAKYSVFILLSHCAHVTFFPIITSGGSAPGPRSSKNPIRLDVRFSAIMYLKGIQMYRYRHWLPFIRLPSLPFAIIATYSSCRTKPAWAISIPMIANGCAHAIRIN